MSVLLFEPSILCCFRWPDRTFDGHRSPASDTAMSQRKLGSSGDEYRCPQ